MSETISKAAQRRGTLANSQAAKASLVDFKQALNGTALTPTDMGSALIDHAIRCHLVTNPEWAVDYGITGNWAMDILYGNGAKSGVLDTQWAFCLDTLRKFYPERMVQFDSRHDDWSYVLSSLKQQGRYGEKSQSKGRVFLFRRDEQSTATSDAPAF